MISDCVSKRDKRLALNAVTGTELGGKMITLLLTVHIMVAVFLIFIVLIQSGKGAELGAAFGGSSQTLFGSRGAAYFFSKLTTIAAVAFMVTSLSLAIVSTKSGSVVKRQFRSRKKLISRHRRARFRAEAFSHLSLLSRLFKYLHSLRENRQ